MIEIKDKSLQGMSFIDLFAGLGGFRIALESLGARCVYSNEWGRAAQKVYAENFGNFPDGDITQVDEKTIPNHDILCAGFPCQAFSISGKQRGFEDSRGTLFFDVARIVKEKKPKVIFMENVKNFASHDNGRTLETVKRTIEKLGYQFHCKVLNSVDYGVPQKRERIYIEECKQIGQFCLKAMKCKASKPKLSGWYYSYGDQIFNEQFDLLKLGRNNEIVNIEIKREMPPKKEKINDQCNRHYMFLKTAFLRYIEKQGIEISKIKLNLLCYEVILENGAFICYQAIDGKRTPMVKNFKEVISSLPNNSGNKKNILFKIFSRENLLISFTQNWEDAKKGLYVLSHQQKDDETKIENLIRDSKSGLYAIEGNAGTGKSLLLFDLAKHISQNGVKVALFCKNGDNLPKFNPYLSTFSFSGLELLNYYEEAVNTKKVITMRDIGDTRRPRNTGRPEDFLYLLPPYVRPEKWPYYLSASPRVQKDMLENVIRPATNTSLIQLCRSYIEDKYTPNERFLDQELLDYRFAEYIHILLRNYAVILIDEAQCLPLKICKDFIQLKNREKAIVFCYDKDQTITLDEKDSKISKLLRGEICKHH